MFGIAKKLAIVVVYTFLLCLAVGASAQQELIDNGSFDTDVDGWMAGMVVGSNGTIEWGSSQGQPPGALRMVGDDQDALPEECFQTTAGFITFSADGYMETSGDFLGCGLNFFFYRESTDCTGEFFVIGTGGGDTVPPILGAQNEWETLEFVVPLSSDGILDLKIPSFRPIFSKFDDFNSDDACVWDNASLRIVPIQPTSIPTMSEAGLAVLSVLIALIALLLLRKRAG